MKKKWVLTIWSKRGSSATFLMNVKVHRGRKLRPMGETSDSNTKDDWSLPVTEGQRLLLLTITAAVPETLSHSYYCNYDDEVPLNLKKNLEKCLKHFTDGLVFFHLKKIHWLPSIFLYTLRSDSLSLVLSQQYFIVSSARMAVFILTPC